MADPQGSAPTSQIAQFRSDGATGATGLRIPFFSDGFSRTSGLPEARLVNFVSEATPLREERPYVPLVGLREIRYSRPGIVASGFSAGAGPIRCLFPNLATYANNLGFVSGQTAYNATGSNLGTIPGTDLVRWAASRNQLVLVASGTAYLYNQYGDNLFTPIASSVLPPVRDVAWLAGRFVYVCQGSDQFYWSEVSDAANVQGLSFASNESGPDNTIGVAVLNDELVFFGQSTVEFWSPNTGAGPTDPAFTPIEGRGFQR